MTQKTTQADMGMTQKTTHADMGMTQKTTEADMGMIKTMREDMAAEEVEGDMAKSAAQKRSTAKRSATEKTGGEKDPTGSNAALIPTHVLTAAATGVMTSARPKSANAGPGVARHLRPRRARPLHPTHPACPRALLLASANKSFVRRAQLGNCTATASTA